MKRVYRSNSELAHAWAHKQAVSGSHTGNIRVEGDIIYSYGYHFPMACHIDDDTVAHTTRRYSNSTSKHLGYVRYAVNHKKAVFCAYPGDSVAKNRSYALADIDCALEQAQSPRRLREKTRLAHLSGAIYLAEQFNEYLEAVGGDASLRIVPYVMDDKSIEKMKELAKKEAEKVQAELARKLAIDEEYIAKWRTYEGNTYGYIGLYADVALRLSKDGLTVETSKGADIPVEDAKKLWPILQKCKVGEKCFEPRMPLGNYQLTKIRENGSIVVGCHDIAYTEMVGIAKQLGLEAA